MGTWHRITGGHNPDLGQEPPVREEPLPRYLYHGTTSLHLDRILEKGLDPGHVSCTTPLATWSARRAVQRWGGDPVRLRIATGLCPDLQLRGTAVDSQHQGIPAHAIHVTILPP